jgi:L-lactate dehydrogenase complex protein LldE
MTMPDKPERVFLFGTCLIDALYPRAGMDVIGLLEMQGIEVLFPQQQTCCGQPAFNAGYRDEARKVARLQLRCLQGDLPVIVPSASCAAMMKLHYGELFRDQPEAQAAAQLSARIMEFTQFLVDVLRVRLEDQGPEIRVAVHDSCSARREMQVSDQLESLIEQLGQVELVHQDHKAECCGFGGSFAVKQAEISAAMVEDKTAALLHCEIDRYITQDCGCMMQIDGALAFQQQPLRGTHIASFLMERIGGGNDD